MARKRDKEYSFEEAMHIARTAAIPHWYFSDPLFFGAVDENDTHYPQPLGEELGKGAWTLFFCSVTGWTFPRTLQAYLEWDRRFQNLGVKSIFVFRERFPLFSGRLELEEWLRRHHIDSPAVSDPDGSLNRAFGGEETYPRLAILHDGVVAHVGSGQTFVEGAEREIHRILRIDSPGLPMQLPWKERERVPDERGFLAVVNEGALATDYDLMANGRWHLERDHLWTQDPEATISLTVRETDVAIVAQSVTEGSLTTRITAVSSLGPIPDVHAARDAHPDSEGNLAVNAHHARTYFFLQKLLPQMRKLTLGFPIANEVPVRFYGFEFATAVK